MNSTKQSSNFEDNLVKLEQIVSKLENGNTSLQDMIKLYEEGIGIANKCKEILNNAELKIYQLNPENTIPE